MLQTAWTIEISEWRQVSAAFCIQTDKILKKTAGGLYNMHNLLPTFNADATAVKLPYNNIMISFGNITLQRITLTIPVYG
jgi:hypothetical protein